MAPFVTPPELQAALDELERRIGPKITQLQGAGPLLIGQFASVGGGRLRYSNIPQSYRHLRIVARLQAQTAATTNAFLQMNGIGGAFYEWFYKTSSQAGDGTGGTSATNYMYLGPVNGTNRGNDNFVSTYVVDVPFYSLADMGKTFHSVAAHTNGIGENGMTIVSGANFSTPAAITSLDVGEVVGSGLGPRAAASLYGIP